MSASADRAAAEGVRNAGTVPPPLYGLVLSGGRSSRMGRDKAALSYGKGAPQLERVMAPIGLDLGGRTPEETAISICAEIIALRTGRVAPSLRDSEGAIHR